MAQGLKFGVKCQSLGTNRKIWPLHALGTVPWAHNIGTSILFRWPCRSQSIWRGATFDNFRAPVTFPFSLTVGKNHCRASLIDLYLHTKFHHHCSFRDRENNSLISLIWWNFGAMWSSPWDEMKNYGSVTPWRGSPGLKSMEKVESLPLTDLAWGHISRISDSCDLALNHDCGGNNYRRASHLVTSSHI